MRSVALKSSTITSSARNSTDCGTAIASALADFGLMISLNLVGCSCDTLARLIGVEVIQQQSAGLGGLTLGTHPRQAVMHRSLHEFGRVRAEFGRRQGF